MWVWHAFVAKATDSNSGERNEKSGSIALTSVNMPVTLSLKVCQQTDQADKPELSWECNPTNKVVDRQLGPQCSSTGMFNPVWVCERCTLTWIRACLSDKTNAHLPHALFKVFKSHLIEMLRSVLAAVCVSRWLSWFCCSSLSFSFSSWPFPGSQLKYCAVVQRRSIYQ